MLPLCYYNNSMVDNFKQGCQLYSIPSDDTTINLYYVAKYFYDWHKI